MPSSGYTGISYPFRITSRGGVAMSTTSALKVTHIEESIRQIFSTEYLERPMEGYGVYTTMMASLFEPNDVALQQIIKTQMVEDIERLEERVEVTTDDIDLDVEIEDDVEYLYATIRFLVIKYNTTYTTKVKVGEIK